MGEFGIGQPVRRKEDVRLLTGNGQFTDDITLDGQVFAAFLRSPHANARIQAIDTTAVRSMDGVIAVYTGQDLVDAGVGLLINDANYKDRAGKAMNKPSRQAMPVGQTRFVGECLAMVVAETPAQARDAADAIEIDFEPLPAIASTAHALEPGAPLVWPEFGTNLVVHWEYGDQAAVEAKLARSHRRVSVDLVNNRLVASPMEPRVAAAEFDAASGSLTVYTPSQGGRRLQMMLSRALLKMAPEKVRVISRDTGGGFGIRSKMYPETVMVAFAARALGRAVKWRGDRSETFVSDYHGRDQINRAEMGLDENGRVTALKVDTLLNVGAYLSENGVRLPMEGGGRIIPADPAQRFPALRRQALADGIMDAAILIGYEARYREPHQYVQRWLDHQQEKVERGLNEASHDMPGESVDVGSIALACALGFLDLRAEGRWRAGHGPLATWLDDFAARVPAFEATRAAS